MIPLSYIVIGWLILLLIYLIFLLLTLTQMLKHGTKSPATVISTFVFMSVSAIVLFASANIVLRSDWSQPVQILPNGFTSLIPGSTESITDITLEP